MRNVDLAGPSSNDLPAGAGTRQPRPRGGGRSRDRPRDDRRSARADALVARKQPHHYGRFAARWLCLYLEEYEKATLEDVVLLVSNLRSLGIPKDHAAALATLQKAAPRG